MGHQSHSVSLILLVMLMAMSTELPITSHCMMMNKSGTPFTNWSNNSLVEFEFDRDLLNNNINGAEGESDLGLAVVMHMVDSEETSRRLLPVQLFHYTFPTNIDRRPICSPRSTRDACLGGKKFGTHNNCLGANVYRRDCPK